MDVISFSGCPGKGSRAWGSVILSLRSSLVVGKAPSQIPAVQNSPLGHAHLVLLPVHLEDGDGALAVDFIARGVLPDALCL